MPARFSENLPSPAFDGPEDRADRTGTAARLSDLRERVRDTDPRAIADRAIATLRDNPDMDSTDAVNMLRQVADMLAGITDRSTGPRRFASLQSEGRILGRLNPRLALRSERLGISGDPVTVPFRTRPYLGNPAMLSREIAGRYQVNFQGMNSAELSDLHAQMNAINRSCGTMWRPVRLRGYADANGDNIHDSIWVNDPRQTGAYEMLSDITTSELALRSAELEARGFQVREHSTWLNPSTGEQTHWVLWEQTPRAYPGAFATNVGMYPRPIMRAGRVFPLPGPVTPPGVRPPTLPPPGTGLTSRPPFRFGPGAGGPGPIDDIGPVPPPARGGPVRFPPGFRG